jgi:5-methylcytosine-specific restriction endonuclease McrA
MKHNPCKNCHSPYHTAFVCPSLPKNTLVTTKPMKKVGKVQKQTQAAVAKWKRSQSPNHQGYYECYLCHKPVDYLMAEHMKSKVRHPEHRTEASNLRPVCADCNQTKGSKNYQP